MISTKLLILIFAMMLPLASYAQTRKLRVSGSSRHVAAQRAWSPFFIKFRSAVETRDRETLKQMMVSDFIYLDGHEGQKNLNDSRDEAFLHWDNNSAFRWIVLDDLLATGGSPYTTRNKDGKSRIFRVSSMHPWIAIFEFHEDGRWYCNAFFINAI
jgi:hypothetical protein